VRSRSQAVFFYTCAVLLALALTATPRTANARLPIFGLLTANLCLEKVLATCLLPHAAPPETLHAWSALCRRLAVSAAAAALGYVALHHTDVGKKTLSALDECAMQPHRKHTTHFSAHHHHSPHATACCHLTPPFALRVMCAAVAAAVSLPD
jgi:hypothetical protein